MPLRPLTRILRAHERVLKAEEDLRRARRDYREEIRNALAAGETQANIAAALGVTRQRIQQLLQEDESPSK